MVKRTFLAFLLAFSVVALARAEKNFVPAGTTLHCRLTQPLSTRLNFQGDPFTASVTEPLVVNGQQVIPVGSTLEGRIGRMERPGHIKGVGEIRLSAEKITLPNGRSFPVNAILLTAYGAEGAKVVGEEGVVKGPNSRIDDLKEIGGGVAAGGILGALFGGLHGTVVGATVGGVAGFADRLRRRGKDLNLPTGTQLEYQLTRPLEIDG